MRPISPGLKSALESGPLLLFLAVFLLLRNKTVTIGATSYSGLVVATLVLVPVTLICTAILWRLTGRLSALQIVTAVILVVLGGMTVWLNDAHFIKMKPTLLYLTFAVVLGVGLALRRNWLQAVLGELVPMAPEGWQILTRRVIALFLGLAVLNEIVWRTMSDGVWVSFKIFGITLIIAAFMALQTGLFRRYPTTAADEAAPGGEG